MAGQQHEPLKHEPPFKQPDDIGHSESNIGGRSFSVHIFVGPQPFKQFFSPFELQKKCPWEHVFGARHWIVQFKP